MTKQMGIEETLNKEGFLIYSVKGISMLPLLEEGKNLVKLVAITKRPALLDVVLFKRNDGSFILHRIVKTNKNSFVIQGDNCQQGETVKDSQVLAIMEGYFTGEKYTSVLDDDYIKYSESKLKDKDNRKLIYSIPTEWVQLISLLKCSVKEEGTIDLPENTNWEKLYSIAKKHSILATTYFAISKENCPTDVFNKWQKAYYKSLNKEILFDEERSKIINKCNQESIPFVQLKGIILNKLYPKNGMREFADNDILISEERIPDAISIMKVLGYEKIDVCEHHTACSKLPFYDFELHNLLLPERIKCHKYFDEIWSRLKKKNDTNSEYIMTDEDYYLYFIVHFFKHYSRSGSGLRSFADLYILNKNYSNINWDYINTILSKTYLSGFYEEISLITDKMFSDDMNITYTELKYIMESGTYGTSVHRINNEIAKSGKFKYFLTRIFLDFNTITILFPYLKKAPILYPFCLILRVVNLFFDKKRLKEIKNEMRILLSF